MGGLGSSMDNDVRPQLIHKRPHRLTVSNIDFVMLVVLVRLFQASLIPARITLRTKEFRSHIIIYTVNMVAQPRKMLNDLTAN
jgi:hypothetical protein